MRRLENDTQRENLIYLFFLVFLLLISAVILAVSGRGGGETSLGDLANLWRDFLPFVILFLVHNFLLAPLFLKRDKRALYYLLASVLLVAFGYYIIRFGDPRRPQMPPFPHDGFGGPGEPWGPPGGPGHGGPLMPEFLKIILGVLLVIANLGIKLYFRSIGNERRLRNLEKENLSQQLQYLRYQINPHLLMNTLNNIHALVDIDPEKAKESIVELSRLLRYILYESDRPTIPLEKEVDFLGHYVSLMRMRYSDEVSIDMSLPQNTGKVEVPPLLFVSFVENAFKHGISYDVPSFIKVNMSIDGSNLHFACENSVHERNIDNSGGIGNRNVRQRLELLYGSDFTLDVSEGNDVYKVELTIPANYDTDPGSR